MICQILSFSKAAERCFISSQGISMAIRRLEDYLSCKLFERSPKGVALTEHARYLLPIARNIVELADNCEEYFNTIHDAGQTLSAMFTRGSVTEFSDIPIEEFRKRHPKVFFEVKHGTDTDCENALDSFEVELALTAGPLDSAKYEAELVHMRRYGILVSRHDPFAQCQKVSINDLVGRPLCMMRERQKTFSVINSVAEAAGVTLTVHEWVDDPLLTYQLVDKQQVIGITTTALVSHFERKNLKFIPFDNHALSWNLYLAMRRGHKLSHSAQIFAQLVRQHRDNRRMDNQNNDDY